MLEAAEMLAENRKIGVELEMILRFLTHFLKNYRNFLLRNFHVLKLICFYFKPVKIPKDKGHDHATLGGVLGTCCPHW